MIKILKINNFAILNNLEINFEKGLNIITGETGAGKSLIIKALKYISGEKLDKDLLTNEGIDVQAILNIDDSIKAILLENDIAIESNEIIVRRLNNKIKGQKIYLNGILVSISLLQEIFIDIMNMCGQNDNIKIINDKYQRKILDDYSLINEDLILIKELYVNYKNISKQILEKEIIEKTKEDKIEYIKYQLTDLNKLNIRDGEEAQIIEELSKVKKDNEIKEMIKEFQIFNEIDVNKHCDNILSKTKSLDSEQKNKIDELLHNFKNDYDRLSLMFFKINKNIKNYDNSEMLKKIELIEKIKKRFGSIEALLEKKKQMQIEINILDENLLILKKLKKEQGEIYKKYLDQANKISNIRQNFAVQLSQSINREIQELNMKGAEFTIKITKTTEMTEYGLDKIEFYISTNKGFESKPLSKIASGGEMSRIMLTINKILANKNTVNILIFDEIDSGISGETGNIIGEKMNSLSKDNQVICISHLPQVAVYSGNHIHVVKKVENNKTKSTIMILNEQEKLEEIARMLGSSKKSKDSAINHANEMYNNIKDLITKGE